MLPVKLIYLFIFAKYCIYGPGTSFLWIGRVNQFRVDIWIMDTGHTKANKVCCHIDTFSFVKKCMGVKKIFKSLSKVHYIFTTLLL